MKSHYICMFLVLVCLFLSCCVQKQEIVCDKPYLRYYTGCCLDANQNGICDFDEPTATTLLVTTTFPASSTSTSQETTTTTTTTTTVSSTSTTLPAQDLVSPDFPQKLEAFRVYEDDENLVAFFYFTNKSGGEVPVEGNMQLTVSDKDRTLYDANITVTKGNYHKSPIGLGDTVHLLYILRVPLSKVKISLYDMAAADLLFTLSDGSYFRSRYKEVSLPKSTDDDYNRYREEQYLDSATPLSITQTKGGVKVTLLRAGYYKKINPENKSQELKYLRIDVEVRNVGVNMITFDPTYSVLEVEKKDYYPGSESSLYRKDVYSGAVQEGYLLFADVPDLSEKSFDLIVGTSTDSRDIEAEHRFNDLAIA